MPWLTKDRVGYALWSAKPKWDLSTSLFAGLNRAKGYNCVVLRPQDCPAMFMGEIVKVQLVVAGAERPENKGGG